MSRDIFNRDTRFAGYFRDYKNLTGPPEIAFWGRSNVGKSSLINALMNKKGLVRTSKSPGCTRQVTFYYIRDFAHLVDFPGYGYAKIGKAAVEKWSQSIVDYLLNENNLHQLFLLFDSCVGLKSNDMEVIDFLESYRVNYQVILTKIDKVKKDHYIEVKRSVEDLFKKCNAMHPEILFISVNNISALDILRKRVIGICK